MITRLLFVYSFTFDVYRYSPLKSISIRCRSLELGGRYGHGHSR